MNKNRHFEYFTGISKKIFKHASFKFIEYRKYAYILSVVIFLAGISTFFRADAFDEGVEFSGGRSYTVSFDKPVNEDQIRDELKTEFGEPVSSKRLIRRTRSTSLLHFISKKPEAMLIHWLKANSSTG
jgi:preprotein translocase subunit SecF